MVNYLLGRTRRGRERSVPVGQIDCECRCRLLEKQKQKRKNAAADQLFFFLFFSTTTTMTRPGNFGAAAAAAAVSSPSPKAPKMRSVPSALCINYALCTLERVAIMQASLNACLRLQTDHKLTEKKRERERELSRAWQRRMSSENRTERERVISELSTTTTKMVTAAAATISIVHFNCLTSPLSSLSLGVAPNMANTHRGGKRERHKQSLQS